MSFQNMGGGSWLATDSVSLLSVNFPSFLETILELLPITFSMIWNSEFLLSWRVKDEIAREYILWEPTQR